jgi:hypothetical protein
VQNQNNNDGNDIVQGLGISVNAQPALATTSATVGDGSLREYIEHVLDGKFVGDRKWFEFQITGSK